MIVKPFSTPVHDVGEYSLHSTSSTLRRLSTEMLLHARYGNELAEQISPIGVRRRDEQLLDRLAECHESRPQRQLTVRPLGSLAKAGRRFTLRRST